MAIFLIYAHVDPQMTARLCAALHPHRVLLHVDLKSNIRNFEAELLKIRSEHVKLTDHRVRVNWAGYSQVRAMRILIEEAVKEAQPQEHLVILSGQDYPIRPVSELVDYLTSHPNVQFIKSFEVAKSSPQYVRQISHRHYRDLRFVSSNTGLAKRARNALIRVVNLISPIPMPALPEDLRVMHGQTHWALTSECASEAIRSATPEIDRFFQFCFSPDEKYFHTLVANGSFGEEIGETGVVPYSGPGNWRYSNFHHIHPSLAKTYKSEDWNTILNSNKYFIRKVESTQSAELLNRIDQMLL